MGGEEREEREEGRRGGEGRGGATLKEKVLEGQ